MDQFNVSDKNKVKRLPKRAQYDKETIYKIVDESLICHVSFVVDNQPFIIPTIHARKDDIIYLHGSKASRMINHIEAGNNVCIAVTHVDGLVIARSVFHNSMNYRSAVLFGKGRQIDENEKMKALELITEKIMPGRWSDSRLPNEKELKATSVAAVEIEEASAKIRTGEPADEEEDYDLNYWAGVIPIKQTMLSPEIDQKLKVGIPVPGYVSQWIEQNNND